MTTDPQTANSAAERVQAKPLDLQTATEIVQTYLNGLDRVAAAHGGQGDAFSDEDILLADAMRELLADRVRMAAELERLRGEDASIKKPSPHSDDWIINDLLFRARRCDSNAAAWDYPGVRGGAESRRYEAKRYRQLVAAAREVWANADGAETTATRPADGTAGMTSGKDAEVPQ
jgi:hypothetical protein